MISEDEANEVGLEAARGCLISCVGLITIAAAVSVVLLLAS